MTTEGIEAVFLTTHNWGKAAKFFQGLGYELEFDTGHSSGQLRNGDGPYLFIAEVPGDQQPDLRLVLKVPDPDGFQAGAAVDQAWRDAGREGHPRKLSLAYFALGPDARQAADTYLKRYYAFTGPIADQIAAGAAVSPDQVRGAASAFEQAGCDELIFVPCSSDPDQVGLLAEVLHG